MEEQNFLQAFFLDDLIIFCATALFICLSDCLDFNDFSKM